MDNQVIRVIARLARDIGSPRAQEVLDHVRKGEWAQLQKLRCRPQDYTDSESYWRDAVITDLLRKCDLPSSVDREAEAVKTFYACEHENLTTNRRLQRFLPETLFLEDQDERVYDFISRWRKNVISLMGNLPDHLTPRFSGGATYADTGLLITTPDKMSSTPTIYSATSCLLPMWGETAWSRALVRERPWQSRPREVPSNVFFTVPKDGTKFRGCCKEASINVSYQLDVGRILKERVKRIGIDLRQGQDLHKQAARQASIDGRHATIDMSNASDTICRVLVKLLLRGDWHELLDSLRATHTRIGGKQVRLEKFSSMGNGFTFELETIIFATLARTVIADEGGDPDSVMCYGDDLIVPTAHYKSVVSGLRFFGFTPNMNKTFFEGPFRESCGGDYWDGTPVRAHYLENLPDEPQHWISLANGLRRVALADGRDSPRWSIVKSAWLCALDSIPSDIRRCRGPSTLGDVVIHDEPERWALAKTPNLRRKVKLLVRSETHDTRGLTALGIYRDFVLEDGSTDGWDQTWVYAYVPVPSVLPWHHWYPEVQLASCTLGLPSLGVTPRGGISGYKVRAIPATVYSTWLPTP